MSPQTKQLASAAGNCSLVQSWSDAFANNYASIGGGAVYATDAASLQLACGGSPLVGANVDSAACAEWVNNTVQSTTGSDALQVLCTQVCLTFKHAVVSAHLCLFLLLWCMLLLLRQLWPSVATTSLRLISTEPCCCRLHQPLQCPEGPQSSPDAGVTVASTLRV